MTTSLPHRRINDGSIGTVLVTGGAGFVGSRLVRRLLDRSTRVVSIDDYSRGRQQLLPKHPALVNLNGDISDPGMLLEVAQEYKPSHIFHLAAMHFIPDCDADPVRTRRINVDGTREAARVADFADSEAFVLVSSAAVYAPDSIPHSEAAALGPLEVYGATKVAAEKVVAKLNARVEIVRLFNVYGALDTNPHVVPAILDQAIAGAHRIRLGRVDTVRDYIYVDDAAEAILALGIDGTGGITNVGSGRGSRVDELVTTLAGIAGRPFEIDTDESRLRPVDRPILVPDIRRMVTATQVRPRSLRDGLSATWAAELAARAPR